MAVKSTLVYLFSIYYFMCLTTLCSSQIAFHTDANTNSYSVKAPGSHQTFTKYFGGQQGALLQHQQSQQPQQLLAQPSQQQQQYAPAPQNYAYQGNQIDSQQALQDAYYAQQQQLSAGSQAQPQYISAQDYAAYLQQQQIQQGQYYASNNPIEQQQAASQQSSVTLPVQNQNIQQTPQGQALLGVAYSPSNQVSHVKFSNGGGLAYNF